ncbi:MAG: ribonuclease D [Acetobacteraceae bacterium]
MHRSAARLPAQPAALQSSAVSSPPVSLLSTTAELAALCARLGAEKFVAVDTEFMRERTYWPRLCLVQLAGLNEAALIDAVAPGIDLAPLGHLLADPAVTKVFHAARQDVEIFLLLFGAVPTPLFDTQVAAMVAGYGDQVGYDQLAASLAGVAIDKAHRFSDWAQRPLSPAQITYAASDVTHLCTVYQKLSTRLEHEGRLAWVAEEMAALADPATYRNDPDQMWERLKPRTNNRRTLAVLRAIAAWREREAQRIDIPRQRLLKDESLLEIAATEPATAEVLARARGVSRGFAEGKSGTSLLAVIAAARQLPEPALPVPVSRGKAGHPAPGLVALLKVLLAARSEAHHVAPRLIASADEIDRLATEEMPDIPTLEGWRREVFGADALALKAGRICLGIEHGRVRLLPMTPS